MKREVTPIILVSSSIAALGALAVFAKTIVNGQGAMRIVLGGLAFLVFLSLLIGVVYEKFRNTH